jgi:hypothetical protein
MCIALRKPEESPLNLPTSTSVRLQKLLFPNSISAPHTVELHIHIHLCAGLSHTLSSPLRLVSHAGFTLAPCRPVSGFQVNQKKF